MTLDFEKCYKVGNIFNTDCVDLSPYSFIHPWPLVMLLLKFIEHLPSQSLSLVLPKEANTKAYLKRIHLDKMFEKIGCQKEHDLFSKIAMSDRDNLNIQPLMFCKYRDEFNAKLEHFLKMFRNFGLSEADSQRATAVIGELGNNVFDHNLGNWPTPIVGALIAGQNYPTYKRVEITIGDPGVGFYESLTKAFPDIKSDMDAIKKGLEGNTGRVGEERGNGLKLIQKWTINNFSGQVMIHSGDGLAIVAKDGIQLRKVHKILGTIAQFVIHYN